MTVDELMALVHSYAEARESHKKWFDSPSTAAVYRAAGGALRTALEAVVADSRRLDWMSRGGIINVDSIGGVDPLDDSRVELCWIRTLSDTGTVDADNLRAAIDAASTTQKGGA